ncbi:MAG TPA: hypothetical protein VFH45_01200, partial [Acidimicrobiales bacterium]|nr:hypothetical protein [Acidimicrobiales bacterium]
MSLRKRAVVSVTAAALVAGGVAGVLSLGGPAGLPSAAEEKLIKQTPCPGGYVVADADLIRAAGGKPACVSSSHPENYQDLASLSSQLQAREAAPFRDDVPGAFRQAVKEFEAMAVTGNSWSPASPTPDCDAHTTESNTCPLTDNTSLAESNGDYPLAPLGHKELAGRINAFAGDPANQQRVWAAPAVGGVFETDNGGASWHSIGDTLPTQAMSGLAYDAPLHRLLAGTGDYSFGADAIQGLGIFYSDNDGQSWTASSGLPDLTIVFKIQPAPAD